jgi:hypothetical protein
MPIAMLLLAIISGICVYNFGFIIGVVISVPIFIAVLFIVAKM